MAFSWIGRTTSFGSQVRNAKVFPWGLGRHTPANANIGRDGTLNHRSCLEPVSPSHSQKSVTGTRQRNSALPIVLFQNELVRLRTLVMLFVIGCPLAPFIVSGTPHCITSNTRSPASCRTTQPGRFGKSSGGGIVRSSA